MITFKQYIIEADKKDTITFDIPLLIRVLELTREDIKDDADLHRVVERLIDIRNKGTLTMDDYNFIAKLKEEYVAEDGMGGGALGGGGPTNVVGSGAIAGTGGKGGEPGVELRKKKRFKPNPVILPMGHRR